MADRVADACRLWLFDIDGTLVAPAEDQLHAWLATFREVFGLEVSPDAIFPHLGKTFTEIVGAVAGADARPNPSCRLRDSLATYTRLVRNDLASKPRTLLPGAQRLLQFLRDHRNIVGVVTGNFPEEGEPKLEGVGLLGLLDLVVYADLTTTARDCLVRRAVEAARALGFRGDFADTVVVGDSVHDVVGAHRTGALAVAVCTGVTPREDLVAAGPDLLVPDLPALLTTLKRNGARWLHGAPPA